MNDTIINSSINFTINSMIDSKIDKLLHDGYIILPHFLKTYNIPTDIEKYLQTNEMNAIFKRGSDKTRFQAKIPTTTKNKTKSKKSSSNVLTTIVNEIIQALEYYFPNHSFVNPVLLKSIPGCQIQPAHSDYPPKESQQDHDSHPQHQHQHDNKREDFKNQSFGLICSIMTGTKFTIWPGLNNTSLELTQYNSIVMPLELNLNPGDILIFKGNQIHAGSAYNILNYRIHIYIDGKYNQMNGKNKTWIVEQNISPQKNRCIELLKHIPENDFKNYIDVIESKKESNYNHPIFYEWDSLTNQERKQLIKEGGKRYFITSSVNPLQGSLFPYPLPHSKTRRHMFLNATKVIWFKGSYYCFEKQNKEIQIYIDNDMGNINGSLLFWILEINPSTKKPWNTSIQLPVLHKRLPKNNPFFST